MAIAPTEANKVALINVQGTISPRLSLMDEISGGCSAEDVGKAFDAAIADETVGTIVLNFDSPGGSVFGIQELGTRFTPAAARSGSSAWPITKRPAPHSGCCRNATRSSLRPTAGSARSAC
jgi:hypothetical protein